jgi:hypothetical protein
VRHLESGAIADLNTAGEGALDLELAQEDADRVVEGLF